MEKTYESAAEWRALLAKKEDEIAVSVNMKMSIFAGQYTSVFSLNHHITCWLETRQALIYQLVLGLTGKNGKYNYSKAVHVYPPFFDITYSAKNYKIAPALTLFHSAPFHFLPGAV